jgi:CTP-dependent riboflavin kinase
VDNSQKEELFRLRTEENLSQKEIGYRLGITQQNVSKWLKILDRKGPQKRVSCKRGVVSSNLKALWRFHSLHFLIYPYYFAPRYYKMLEKRGNYLYYRDWKISLHSDMVEFVLRRGYDFISRDKFEAIRMAQNSLNRALYELSNRFGFYYEKEGRISIKLVKSHLARTNSHIAKGLNKEYIQVKGIEGKVWFIIDKSRGILEHEYTDSKTYISDSEKIEAFFNDIRENPEFKPSFLGKLLIANTEQNRAFTLQLKKHLEVLNKIGEALDKLQKKI